MGFAAAMSGAPEAKADNVKRPEVTQIKHIEGVSESSFEAPTFEMIESRLDTMEFSNEYSEEERGKIKDFIHLRVDIAKRVNDLSDEIIKSDNGEVRKNTTEKLKIRNTAFQFSIRRGIDGIMSNVKNPSAVKFIPPHLIENSAIQVNYGAAKIINTWFDIFHDEDAAVVANATETKP